MAESIEMPNPKAVIVFDGECAFCRQAISAIRSRDRDRQFIYQPRQTPGIEEQYPELKVGDFDAGMRLFEPGGTMHIGADAIYQITLRLPYFRRFSWMYRLPLLKSVIRGVYSWIAANRLKLSRYCGAECRLGASEGIALPAGSGHQMSASQIVISLFVLVIVGLHGWATVAKVLFPSSLMGDQSWPFLAYGMYRTSHQPGTIQTTRDNLVAVTAHGLELKVTYDLVGMYSQPLNRDYLGPMRSGDPSAARRLADRLNRDREDPIVEFREDSETYAITDAGVVLESKRSVSYPAVH